MYWLILATCLLMATVIWYRRWTLRPLTEDMQLSERAITVSLLIQGLALLLTSRMGSATLGHVLHTLTGQYHLNTWIGDCLYMGAAALIGVNACTRLDISVDDLRASFKKRVELPMTLLVPTLLWLLTLSPNADRDYLDLYETPTDYALDAYWTLLATFIMYIMYRTITVLLILYRKTPGNRRLATVYLAACIVVLCGGALRLLTTWTDDLTWTPWYWYGDCGCIAMFGIAAALSWRRKVNTMGATTTR